MQNQLHSDYSALNDDALVSLAQQGDRHAFASLIERHYSATTRLALSILHDRQDAEDEVQNACWKAYQGIRNFQREAKFTTWLTRIVVNQCLMRLRRARRSRTVYLEDTAEQDARVRELPADGDTPEQTVAKSELARVLEGEIKAIPPLLRQAFLLRDVEERPMEEVAGRLGISVAAAKSRLLRARAELRRRLVRHEGRLGVATLFA